MCCSVDIPLPKDPVSLSGASNLLQGGSYALVSKVRTLENQVCFALGHIVCVSPLSFSRAVQFTELSLALEPGGTLTTEQLLAVFDSSVHGQGQGQGQGQLRQQEWISGSGPGSGPGARGGGPEKIHRLGNSSHAQHTQQGPVGAQHSPQSPHAKSVATPGSQSAGPTRVVGKHVVLSHNISSRDRARDKDKKAALVDSQHQLLSKRTAAPPSSEGRCQTYGLNTTT